MSYLGAQSALNSVSNHPVTQDVKNTVNNGMVSDTVSTTDTSR